MISCLCVTHERPEFIPWVVHQFEKQVGDRKAELVIVDSSDEPCEPYSKAANVMLYTSGEAGIAAKRTEALSRARGEFITWFDDDDWQHPSKLQIASDIFEAMLDGECVREPDAVGSRHASSYSTVTGKCCAYESRYEPLIFNSAVYRKSAVPKTFNTALITQEDTDWHDRFFATRPNYITVGASIHAWLCHYKNITNNHKSKFFELECNIPFDAWELDFLKRLHT